MASTLLAPTTAASTATTLTLAAGETAYIFAEGANGEQLAASEIIDIEYYNGTGYSKPAQAAFTGLVGTGSNPWQFDSNNNARSIGGGDSITVRFNKPLTNSAIGIYRG